VRHRTLDLAPGACRRVRSDNVDWTTDVSELRWLRFHEAGPYCSIHSTSSMGVDAGYVRDDVFAPGRFKERSMRTKQRLKLTALGLSDWRNRHGIHQ